MTVNRFNFTVRTAAPTGLSSTATTSSSVSLSWAAVPYATGYRLYRGGVLVASPTGTTATDSGLAVSTSYSYTVSAVSAGGESAQSEVVQATTLSAGGTLYGGYTPTVIVTTAAGLNSALASATAGTIIGVDPGVYTQTGATNDRWAVAWHPASSGTSGNPIIIVAKYDAVRNASSATWSELRNGLPTSAGSPTIGCNGRNYIYWHGFYVNDAVSTFYGGTANCVLVAAASYCRILYCRFSGVVGGGSGVVTDSYDYAGIRSEGANNCVISDCLFSNYINTTGGHQNQSGIQLDSSQNFTVEHNTMTGCSYGIVCKADYGYGGLGGNTIRFNRITGKGGFELGGVNDTLIVGTERVYQNLFIGLSSGSVDGIGFRTRAYSATCPRQFQVYNNTFAGFARGIFIGNATGANSYDNSLIRDNLIHAGIGPSGYTVGIELESATTLADVQAGIVPFNYNHVSSTTPVAELGDTEYTSMANFYAATGFQQNGATSTATFINTTDYKLAVGSPALTTSSTGGPVGCYLDGTEVMGVRA